MKQSFQDTGLRSTPQRYAVMAFLMEHNSHPTAAEIYEAVNRVDPRSSKATTYNNLRDLVKAGLVREVAVEVAPRDTMQKARGITTSSAIAAAMWRISNGTILPALPWGPWASGSFGNASLFFAGSARNARRGALPGNIVPVIVVGRNIIGRNDGHIS